MTEEAQPHTPPHPEPGLSPAAWDVTGTPEHPTVSPLEVLNVLLKRLKVVLGLPLITAVLTGIVSFLIPPKFTAIASFVVAQEATQSNIPGSIAGIASQFGIGLGAAAARSPDFYAKILLSRTIADELLETRFPDPRTRDSRDTSSVLDILEIGGKDNATRLEAGRKELGRILTVSTDRPTALITVSAETRYPTLSARILNRLLDLLNHFNLETRQSSAQARRRFVEGRLGDAETELRAGESELQRFLERNRNFNGSPQLQFEHDRLQRQVAVKQEVLVTLRRQYEEARIQEVNDTPVITVVDRAVVPNKKSSPRRILNVALALMLGTILGLALAFGSEFMEQARERDREHFLKVSARWTHLRDRVRSPLKRYGAHQNRPTRPGDLSPPGAG